MDAIRLAADVIPSEGLGWGVVVAVFFAGLRHGFDLDHIAAIADITSSQTRRGRALQLATLYAAGHALVLTVLGAAAVIAGARIPPSFDRAMGRLVGATLIALGVYVVYSMVRFRRDFRLRSRWMLVLAGVRKSLMWLRRHAPDHVEIEHAHPHPVDGHHHPDPGGLRQPDAASGPAATVAVGTRVHVHPHKHVVVMPADPFVEYGIGTSFGVGMIHGVGAETPSQVVLFATAAGVAGSIGGMLVLVAFVVGLLVGNTFLAVAATKGFIGGQKLPRLYMVLAGATALISVYIGSLYLLGIDEFVTSWFAE